MDNTRDLTFVRLYGASRDIVFKAWTDSELLAKWWGPRLFTAPVCEIDARENGSIKIDMKGPDGNIYPMKGTVLEINPPEKLVFRGIAAEDEQGNPLLETITTVSFEDFNGMTKMIVHVHVVKTTPQMAMALDGMEQGWSESLYRLGDILDQEQQ